MAKPLRRYLWLIETVSRAGNITYDEIRRKWIDSPVNDLEETDYPKRTFLSHIEEIKGLFGLSILCDRRNDYKYYIASEESIPERIELIGTLSLSMKLVENQDLREKVRFTAWDYCNRHIPVILDALERKCTIEIAQILDSSDVNNKERERILAQNPAETRIIISDDGFYSPDEFVRITWLQPYYLEFVNHTWFVLGYSPVRKRMEAYRLSRFSALELRENMPFRRNDTLCFEDVKNRILTGPDGHTGRTNDLFDDRDDYRLFNRFSK